jgi:hypothetical protein
LPALLASARVAARRRGVAAGTFVEVDDPAPAVEGAAGRGGTAGRSRSVAGTARGGVTDDAASGSDDGSGATGGGAFGAGAAGGGASGRGSTSGVETARGSTGGAGAGRSVGGGGAAGCSAAGGVAPGPGLRDWSSGRSGSG